jgi:transmembrane sensor
MAEIENKMLRNIHNQMHEEAKTKPMYGSILLKVAASIVLVLLASYLFFYQEQATSLVTVRAPKGVRKFLLLPDSSKVWLNAGAVLQYSKNFHANRQINLLEGEAFFDVKHHESSRFVVYHKGYYAKVLGTAFNVKISRERDLRVTVTRGKVEVGDEKSKYTILTPNKEMVLSNIAARATRTIRTIDAIKVSGWVNNQIHLYDVPFDHIIASIEGNYNVKISYPTDKMKNEVSTLHYCSGKSLAEVLEMIKLIHGLEYKIEGKEVYLSSR